MLEIFVICMCAV